jgi:hypothetical protein
MKMRFLGTGLLLILTGILMAACGGGQPAPTAALPTEVVLESAITPEQADLATPDPNFTQAPFPTIRPTFEGELVPGDSPRTLVASRTEDPDANVPFSLVRIERTGGPDAASSPEPVVVEITGAGQVTYGSKTGTLSQGVIDLLNTQVREMSFFGASGDYLGVIPLEGVSDYLYAVTVTRGDLSRTIQMRDGYMPQEFQVFVATVLQEGFKLP